MGTEADRRQEGHELCKRMVGAGYSRDELFYALIAIARTSPEIVKAALAEAEEFFG